MSEILCKHHGMQSVSFTAPSLADRIIQEGSLGGVTLIKMELNLPFGRKGVFWVDKSFLDHHSSSDKVEDEDRSYEIYCELRGICSQCLKEAIDKNQRGQSY